MVRGNVYHTRQKEMLLEIIKNLNREFTIKDIYELAFESVGLTTVYRYIDSLEKVGKLSKRTGKNKAVYYEYLEECAYENHFYLKCEKCGKMEHIDCDCITTLNNHILNSHHFQINREHIIINGICHSCS